MPVARLRERQRALQIDLPWRAREQVGAAHDSRDILECIVDHDRELVASQSIATFDDDVATGAEVEALRALELVIEVDRPIAHAKANRRRAGSSRARSTCARIAARVILGREILARATASKGPAHRRESRERFAIRLASR